MPAQQLRDVRQANVTAAHFFVAQRAHAARPFDLAPVEGEVYFLDAIAFRDRTKGASAPLRPPL
jgi:hypothetical protein